MANTYSWTINQMTAYPTYESQTDVVFQVAWTCTGSNGATPPVTASIYNTVNVTYKAGEPFTPYDQLTQAQVVGWVQEALTPEGVAATEAALDTMIANQVNPPVVSLPLPWVTAAK
jgi:hypothetical protein